jgi:hypothetical protein
LSAKDGGEALSLSVSKWQRIVRGDLMALGGPSPAVGITTKGAGPRFHLDKDKSNRCKDEDIDFVYAAFVVDKFKVRPGSPWLMVWQVLAQEY